MKCPFCYGDVGQLFRELRKDGGAEGGGTLCTDCGEPLFITTTGFRKPTPDEYVEIGDNAVWKGARLAWLEVQAEQEKPSMLVNWLEFVEGPMAHFVGVMPEPDTRSGRILKLAEMMFHCGAVSALHTFRADLQRCESALHLDAACQVHHAELIALFKHLGIDTEAIRWKRKGKRNDGRQEPGRRPRRGG